MARYQPTLRADPRLCRFQIPLVVGMFDGFLSAKLGLPLEYLNEDYAPLAVCL